MNIFFESFNLEALRKLGRTLSRKITVKLATVGLVSFSLWSLSAPSYAVPYQEGDRGIQSTERYEQIQPEKGGVNNFDAVDPRRNTKQSEAKARELSNVAERRSKQASDPLEPAREAVDQLQTQAAKTADNLTADVKEAASNLGDS
ncbi:MAG: hypothetical protein AAFR18_18475 [Cyanobacteria bacterium J06627_32]